MTDPTTTHQGDPTMNPERARYLPPDRRLELAADPTTSDDLLAVFADDPQANIVEAVASNPNADSLALTVLAASNIERVRRAVALHPNTPTELVDRLAFDVAEVVRAMALTHPNASPALLRFEMTASDMHHVAVASNPSAPASVLHQLAESPTAEVRVAVASNPHISDVTRALLETDLDFHVTEALKKNPALMPA